MGGKEYQLLLLFDGRKIKVKIKVPIINGVYEEPSLDKSLQLENWEILGWSVLEFPFKTSLLLQYLNNHRIFSHFVSCCGSSNYGLIVIKMQVNKLPYFGNMDGENL